MTASAPNTAKQEQIAREDSATKDYPDAQTNHLRMYVYTGYEYQDKYSTKEDRDGYYIDFELPTSPANTNSNVVTSHAISKHTPVNTK